MVRRAPATSASRSVWSSRYAASIAGCQAGSVERSRIEPRLRTDTSVGAAVNIRLVGSLSPLS